MSENADVFSPIHRVRPPPQMRHDPRVFKIGSGIVIKPTNCYATLVPLDPNCMKESSKERSPRSQCRAARLFSLVSISRYLWLIRSEGRGACLRLAGPECT